MGAFNPGEADVYQGEGGIGEARGLAAFLGDGPLVLDEADTAPGGPISGSAERTVSGGG